MINSPRQGSFPHARYEPIPGTGYNPAEFQSLPAARVLQRLLHEQDPLMTCQEQLNDATVPNRVRRGATDLERLIETTSDARRASYPRSRCAPAGTPHVIRAVAASRADGDEPAREMGWHSGR